MKDRRDQSLTIQRWEQVKPNT